MTIDESKVKAKETVQAMFQMVNGAKDEFTRELSNQLLREHRTLQQNMIRTFLTTLVNYATYHEENPTCHDLRNQESVKLAKLIKQSTKDVYLPFV